MVVSDLARARGMIVHACQPSAMDCYWLPIRFNSGATPAGLGPSFAALLHTQPELPDAATGADQAFRSLKCSIVFAG